MERINHVGTKQGSQLIFHSPGHQSNTCKDQMNGNTGSGFKASDQVSRLNAGLHVLVLTN
jgi:hypothetical protein